MKRVIYIGNFRPKHSTETYIAKALENIGWSVDRIQEDTLDIHDTIRRCSGDDVKFLLWTRTWIEQEPKIKQILDAIEIPSASVHLDIYIGISRGHSVDEDLFWRTDHVFTADGGHNKEFRERGINHHFLPPGVDRDGCHVGHFNERFAGAEIVFLGSYAYHKEWSYRPRLIDWLEQTYGDNFRHWGHESNIWGELKNDLFATAKICIGDTLQSPRYTSDRLVETCGRGGFIITPRIEGLELYKDREHCIEYEYFDYDELKEKIDYYLEQPEERGRMVSNAIEYTLDNHTWDHRVTEMINVMGLD